MSRRVAIVFVCQQGYWESQAALLAASLRRFAHSAGELIAAVPSPADVWGEPSPRATRFLKKLGVRMVPITNPIGKEYPIANKIACLSVPTDADKLVFLDTDMLAMAPWTDDDRFGTAFNARPAAVATFSGDADHWQRVYAACDAPALHGRVATTYSNELIPPYFNSGFVAVPAHLRFGDVWLDCCRRVDAAPDIPNKRPHLDQIGLSAAISKLGLEYDCLDERYNHQIVHRPLDAGKPPFLCHYHFVWALASEPSAVAVLRDLTQEHPELAAILMADTDFSALTDPGDFAAALATDPLLGLISGKSGEKFAAIGQNLLITGIPHSGEEELCQWLSSAENCLALPEPRKLTEGITDTPLPWRVPHIFQSVRRQVLCADQIPSQLPEGKLLFSRPALGRNDFYLAVKSMLPTIGLTDLRRALPQARILACVANPFDTIARWKAAGYEPAAAHKSLPLATSLAATWDDLARMILESAAYVRIIRRDWMTTDGASLVPGLGACPELFAPPLHLLDRADIQAIRALCSESATAINVYRPAP